MIRKSINKMKNGKAAESLDLVSGMGKSGGEAGVDITNLVNQDIVEEFSPAEWELSTIVYCYKQKRCFRKRKL